MWSRPSAMVLLIAGILLASGVGSLRAASAGAGRGRTTSEMLHHRSLVAPSVPQPSALVLLRCFRTLSVPHLVSVSPFEPWQHRRKAVLEESDPRIIEETDLGPAPVP